MRQFVSVLIMGLLGLHSPASAQGCWDSGDQRCFQDEFARSLVAFVEEGPRYERLRRVAYAAFAPRRPETAEAILNGVTLEGLIDFAYKDELKREARAKAKLNGKPDPYAEALKQLEADLGFEVPSPDSLRPIDYLDPDLHVKMYQIVKLAGDAQRAIEWYDSFPDGTLYQYQVVAMEGADTRDLKPPFNHFVYASQDQTVEVLVRLENGQVADAMALAQEIPGEPGFVAWRSVASDALARGNKDQLAQAITGIEDVLDRGWAAGPRVSDEELDLAMKAAEESYRRSGDPDEMVAILEEAGSYEEQPPLWAYVTLHLLRELHAGKELPGWKTLMLQVVAELQEERDDRPFIELAMSALAHGQTERAKVLWDAVLAHSDGIPGFWLYAAKGEPWEATWTDWMEATYLDIIEREPFYSKRRYWDIWQDQDALSEGIDLIDALARTGRTAKAQKLVPKLAAYIHRMDPGPEKQASSVFMQEVAFSLYPPEEAAKVAQQHGMDHPARLSLLLFERGAHLAALQVYDNPEHYFSPDGWLKGLIKLPEDQRNPLIAPSLAKIDQVLEGRKAEYPRLYEDDMGKTAVFLAQIGRFEQAKTYFDKMSDAEERLTVLYAIAYPPKPVEQTLGYPYQDFGY